MRFISFALAATTVAISLKSNNYDECVDVESEYCNMYYELLDEQAKDGQADVEQRDADIDNERNDAEAALNDTVAYHNDTITEWYDSEL